MLVFGGEVSTDRKNVFHANLLKPRFKFRSMTFANTGFRECDGERLKGRIPPDAPVRYGSLTEFQKKKCCHELFDRAKRVKSTPQLAITLKRKRHGDPEMSCV